MKQKLIALALTLAMIVPLVPQASAFYNQSSWAAAELNEANYLGIVPDSMANVDMQKYIPRSEMCQIAAIAYEKLTGNTLIPSRTDYFSDTEDPIICAAYEIGIVSGYEDGSFRPDNRLTRQEFFQIVSNFFQTSNVPTVVNQDYLANFVDRNEVADWAEAATQVAVGTQVVTGSLQSDNSLALNPTARTTRQEALLMFLRCFKSVSGYMLTTWLTAEDVAALEETAKEEGASEEVQNLVNYALSLCGSAYVFGHTGPTSFDCSGFVQYVYAQFGYSISRVASAQASNGVHVDKENLIPGDLVFFGNTYASSDWITHVGMYIGDGKFVHAANTTRGVTVDELSTSYYATRYAGARRILN